MIYKGNTLTACVLGCEWIEEGEKVFFSHKGTTFGGIVIGKQIYNATSINELMDCMEDYLRNGKIRICWIISCIRRGMNNIPS